MLLTGLTLPAQSADEPAATPALTLKHVKARKDFQDWATAVAFSPDGQQLAAGSYNEVRIYSGQNWEKQRVVELKSGRVTALVFDAQGQRLIVGGYQRIQIVNLEQAGDPIVLKGHRGQVNALHLAADDRTLISGSEDESVRIWNIDSNQTQQTIPSPHGLVQDLALSPDGKSLAVALGDPDRPTRPGHVVLMELASGKTVAEFDVHSRSASCVAFSSDGKRLLSGGIDEKIYQHDLDQNQTLNFYGGHSRPIHDVIVLSANSAVSASGGRATGKNEVRLWNFVDGDEYGEFAEFGGPVLDLAFDSTQHRLAAASRDGSVHIFEIAGLKNREAAP